MTLSKLKNNMNLKLILRQQFSLPHRLSSRPSRSGSSLHSGPQRPSLKSFVLKQSTSTRMRPHKSRNNSDSKASLKKKQSKMPRLSKKMGSKILAQHLTLQIRNTEPLRKPRRHPQLISKHPTHSFYIAILPDQPPLRLQKKLNPKRLESCKRDKHLHHAEIEYLSLANSHRHWHPTILHPLPVRKESKEMVEVGVPYVEMQFADMERMQQFLTSSCSLDSESNMSEF